MPALKNLLLLILLLSGIPGAFAQPTMAGLKLGDPRKAVKALKLQIIAEDGDMIKYATYNGNSLSVTTENGEVVYMENDWSRKAGGSQTVFKNFTFGKTSLRDITNTFESNGFAYKERFVISNDTEVILFNCYQLSKTNQVVSFATKVAIKDRKKLTDKNAADHFLLFAIIIAREYYLDEIWGKEKSFDPVGYKTISPSKISGT